MDDDGKNLLIWNKSDLADLNEQAEDYMLLEAEGNKLADPQLKPDKDSFSKFAGFVAANPGKLNMDDLNKWRRTLGLHFEDERVLSPNRRMSSRVIFNRQTLAIQRLPIDLLDDLCRSLNTDQFSEFNKRLEKVKLYSEGLALHLETLAHEFDYDKLLKPLGESNGESSRARRYHGR